MQIADTNQSVHGAIPAAHSHEAGPNAAVSEAVADSPRQAAQRALIQGWGLESGSVAQRAATKLKDKPNASFSVKSSDLGTGTATNTGTREYVNDGSTTKPGTIAWDYVIPATSTKAKETASGSVSNPSSLKSGGKWDAGHLLGRQNGGLGNDNAWVFPQNPQINRGNSDDADDPTFTEWRAVENDFKAKVESAGSGTWNISLS